MKFLLTHDKKILIILVLILSNISSVFADCNIKNTPEYLLEFTKNVKKLNNNINNAAQKWPASKEDLSNFVYWILNKNFSWKRLESSSEFYTQNEAETPKQILRDIKFLEKTLKNVKLNNYQYAKVKLKKEDICNWISDDLCIIEDNIIAIEAIRELKESVLNVLYLIKWNTNWFIAWNKEKFLLFPKEYIIQLKKDYSQEAVSSCSKIEDNSGEKWFFAKIIDYFVKLKDAFHFTKNSKNSWKEAVSMIKWWFHEFYVAITKEFEAKKEALFSENLYKDYKLSNDINAKANNNEAFSKTNFLNSISQQLDSFQKAIKQDSQEISERKETIARLINTKRKIDKSVNTAVININTYYTQLKELSQRENKSSDILLWRMVKMHLNIANSINLLNKSCKKAVNVCNSQKRWMWDCWECYY